MELEKDCIEANSPLKNKTAVFAALMKHRMRLKSAVTGGYRVAHRSVSFLRILTASHGLTVEKPQIWVPSYRVPNRSLILRALRVLMCGAPQFTLIFRLVFKTPKVTGVFNFRWLNRIKTLPPNMSRHRAAVRYHRTDILCCLFGLSTTSGVSISHRSSLPFQQAAV